MSNFAGFDCGSYPGDDAMRAWAGGNSPYRFVGFYLDAPCHSSRFTSFSGKYHFLNSLGWGLIVVYVGRQQVGCGATSLSRGQGLADGADTIAKCNAEGFPPGAIVYLDVEHFDGSLSPAMADYYRGWLSAILDSGSLQPGTYCAKNNITDLAAAARQEYTAHGVDGAPSFWIVRSGIHTFDPAASAPADCGVAFADVWQGKLDIPAETHNNVTLSIDQNVANNADPSRTFVTAAAGTGDAGNPADNTGGAGAIPA